MKKTTAKSLFINPSEAIDLFKKNKLIAGCFVTAIFDECDFPIPVLIVDPLNDDLTNFVIMIDGNGMIKRKVVQVINEIVKGKNVRMRYSD